MKKFRSIERAIKRGNLKVQMVKSPVVNEKGETVLGDRPELYRKVKNGNQGYGTEKGRWIKY